MLAHELAHALAGKGEEPGKILSGQTTDYRQETVTFANQIHKDLGIPERNSYFGGDENGDMIPGFQYTNGAAIDRSIARDRDLDTTHLDRDGIVNSNDLLIGGSSDNRLKAGDGNDFLYGMGGDDHLYGGSGQNHLYGGQGFDKYYIGQGRDYIFDSDSQGAIYYLADSAGEEDSIPLPTGYRIPDSENSYQTEDKRFLYRFSQAPDSPAGVGTLSIFAEGRFIATVKGYNKAPGQNLGIILEENNDSAAGSHTHNLEENRHHLAVLDASQSPGGTLGLAGLVGAGVITELAQQLNPGLEVIAGGDREDVIIGSQASEVIRLGGGHDYAVGGQGNDYIYGGDGDDYIVGGMAIANMSGQVAPSSSGFAGAGQYQDDDYLVGGQGRDVIIGGQGNDVIICGETADEEGSTDQAGDWAVGGQGDDHLYGSRDGDALYGGAGRDVIMGNGGDDMIFGDSDRFTVAYYGEESNPFGDNTYTLGFREILYRDNQGLLWRTAYNEEGYLEPVEIADEYKLDGEGNPVIDPETGGKVTLTEGRMHVYSPQGWRIIITREEDLIEYKLQNDGYGGGQRVDPAALKDSTPGAHDDFLFGGAGNDFIVGQLGNDILDGGEGDDCLHGDEDTFHLQPGYNDGLSSEGDDLLYGGAGADHLYGGGGGDVLYADAGFYDADPLNVFDGAQDQLAGGAGNDYLYAGSGRDILFGEDGDDYLYGGRDALYLDGGEGNDYIVGAAMEDPDMASYIKGGGGDDVMLGNTGTHYMEGGTGHDTYQFQSEHFKSGRGQAIITDEDGDWTLILDGRVLDGSQMVKVSPAGFHWRSQDNSFELFLSGAAAEGQSDQDLFIRWLDENGRPVGRPLAIIGGGGQDGFARLNLPDWVEPTEISGTEGNDVLIAAGDGKTIYGYGGDDWLEARGGENVLLGGEGFDTYNFKREVLLPGDGLEDLVYDSDGRWELRLDGNLIHGSQTTAANSAHTAWWAKDGSYELREDGADLYFQLLDSQGRAVGKTVRLAGAVGQDGYQVLALPQPPPNQAPLVAGSLSDLSCRGGQDFSFTIPSGLFSDPDGDALTYVVTLADGSPLPGWLNFNPAAGVLSGRPEEAGQLALALKAFDGRFYSPEARLNITISAANQGTSGDDILNGSEADDVIYGLAGNDQIYGHGGDDYLDGGSGHDALYGGSGDDQLIGGPGNDFLEGGVEANVYYYERGDGTDELLLSAGELATIRLGPGFKPQEIFIGRSVRTSGGYDTEIWCVPEDGPSQRLFQIKAWENLQAVEFADGSRLDQALLRARYGQLGHSGAESLSNPQRPDGSYCANIYGLDGNDELYAKGAVDSNLYGQSGDDVLYDGTGNNRLEDGRGNDSIYARYGHNTIVFNRGDGQDTIYIYEREGNQNILLFGPGITVEDLAFEASEARHLVISLKNSTDQVTVKDFFQNSTLGNIVFADGQTLSWADLGHLINFQGEDLDDNCNIVSWLDRTMDGGARNNRLKAGGRGRVTFIGGRGDDDLWGNSGRDVFVYNPGDGQDTIQVSGSHNLIRFGEGIGPEDLQFEKLASYAASDHLSITFKNQPGRILVWVFFAADIYPGEVYPLAGLELANGQTLSLDDILDDILGSAIITGTAGDDYLAGAGRDNTIYGLAGDYTINGSNGNDTIVGSKGDDCLIGGAGSDLYLFNKGDGRDYIDDVTSLANEVNTLRLGAGLSVSDLLVSHDFALIDTYDSVLGRRSKKAYYDGDVRLNFKNNATDQITIADEESGPFSIQRLEFADGTVFTSQDLFDRLAITTATSGSDKIAGNAQDNIIDGLAENDYLLGLAGNDTLKGGADNDYLWGGEGDDILEGGAGHDTLFGEAGNDRLYGGDGNDFLEDLEAGDNYFDGGAGDDIYYTHLRSQQYIDNNGGGFDVLMSNDLDPRNSWFTRQGNDLLIDFARPSWKQDGQIT